MAHQPRCGALLTPPLPPHLTPHLPSIATLTVPHLIATLTVPRPRCCCCCSTPDASSVYTAPDLKSLDLNDDGIVDEAEFLSDGKGTAAQFARYDTNGDGKLDVNDEADRWAGGACVLWGQVW